VQKNDLHGLEHMEITVPRVFDKKAISEAQLQAIIKIDLQQWRMAWSHLTDIT
jgi:hypothetical protein